jgi:sodium ion-translocating decarboxylase beta subunit
MFELFESVLGSSGFGQATWQNFVMMGVGILFIVLAIKKGFEPLLLVPIGFGILIGNIPYNVQDVGLSVYDGPVSETKLEYYATRDVQIVMPDGEIRNVAAWEQLPKLAIARDLAATGGAIMAHQTEYLVYDGKKKIDGPGVYEMYKGGHQVFVSPQDLADPEVMRKGRFHTAIKMEQQDIDQASVLWVLSRGIMLGFFPPLIFLGVGALTDFGPLLAQPRLILLGAAAQFGIFGALLLALLFGFNMDQASSIGIIGGADGPTAIFTATKLAPELLGAIALAAYSYMAMVPIIQPPIMRLLTTKAERRIRMEAPKDVSRTARIVFPIAGFILTAMIANAALPLLGFLFFGNLLRESLVTERLAKTAQTSFIDIITILLGVCVGAKTQASNFLTIQTIQIFILGIVAFGIATASGVMFAKVMNLLSKDKINPLIGAAGVSAVPMAARVVQRVAQEEDKQNFLLMHAMGPNVAGVIGSAVAAGVLLSHF